ncbi:hypothetical protein N9L68_00245 [bacterium]|nr:hypothetical protein [bacterium]
MAPATPKRNERAPAPAREVRLIPYEAERSVDDLNNAHRCKCGCRGFLFCP